MINFDKTWLNEPIHPPMNFIVGTEGKDVILSFGDVEVLLTPALAREVSKSIASKADEAEFFDVKM